MTAKQKAFLLLYRQLELELGRPPTLRELGEEAGYSEGSETAGAQRMLDKLVDIGLVTKPEYVPVGGGTTRLGLEVLEQIASGE